MVDNTSMATKSALQAAFSSASTLPLLVTSSSVNSHSSSGGGGGMKLEAVMENLQRQQAARLALEEKIRQAEKEKDIRSMVESQIQQQALAFRHYQAAVRGAFAAGAPNSSSGHPNERTADSDIDDDDDDADLDLDRGMDDEERDLDEDDSMNEGGGDEDLEGHLAHYPPRHAVYPGAGQSPKSTPIHLSRVQPPYPAPGQAESPSGLAPQAQSQHHEWTYEEQFKQSGQGSGPGRKLKESSVAFGGSGSSSLIQEHKQNLMTFDLFVDLTPSHRHKTRLAAHRFLTRSLIIKEIKGLLSQSVLFSSVMFAQLLQKQLQLPSYEEAIRHNGGNKAGSCAESLCHPPSHPSIPLFFQGLRHTTLSLTSFHTVCSHAWPADFSGSVYLAWLQLADGAAAACRQSLTDVWRHGKGFML
ncbi:AT-rich interactive domain-containing protein 3A [Anabarilius grahami]|uniref:AT-rich interactive domain-containing protein 3A n=1 Tax=Anabarilius grahami TaxID=495550 RepID=A0A3N0YZJ4_ANAGA|nr:AT-rich interactive domain-containing protein 3A [Anabarilius grahami]